MSDLQARVAEWHRRRFPEAKMYHVAIKAMEEMGEVAQAVNGEIGTRDAPERRGGSVAEESADVVIALMALVDRFTYKGDLLAEVERKLAKLTDPNSGHRSALKGTEPLREPKPDTQWNVEAWR
jgi:NTP pyrophosphatase (non-canonical NTP hydrolase)